MQVIREATQALPKGQIRGEKVGNGKVRFEPVKLGSQNVQSFENKQQKWDRWDDKTHEQVIKITATEKDELMTSIQFQYVNSDGSPFTYPVHGKADGEKKEFMVDSENDYLKKMSGSCDAKGHVIGLRFETNLGKIFVVGKDPEAAAPVPDGQIIGFYGTADQNGLSEIGTYKQTN